MRLTNALFIMENKDFVRVDGEIKTGDFFKSKVRTENKFFHYVQVKEITNKGYIDNSNGWLHFFEDVEYRAELKPNFILINNKKKLNNNDINNENLLQLGFVKNYEFKADGFYSLHINDFYFLTIGYEKMTISLHKKYIGHLIEFKNINTIKDIENLIKIIE